MRSPIALRIVPALLLAAASCARPSTGPGCPGSAELFRDPRALRAQADRAIDEKKDAALAYRYLALLEVFHPDGPESREAFPLAAALFRRLYRQNRYAHPDSIWLTSEPVFMFQWLERFFGGDAFPGDQARALFVGMPYPLFVQFSEYAKQRAELSGWLLHGSEDDGVIDAVTGERAESSLSHASGAR
jgi:hypothetical protein